MFLTNYNNLYLRRRDIYLVRFAIPDNPKYNVKNIHEDNTFMCDKEFLDKIAEKVCPSIKEFYHNLEEDSRTKRKIWIFLGFNDLDQNFLFLIRIYPNIIDVFKVYFDLENLDKLCKN